MQPRIRRIVLAVRDLDSLAAATLAKAGSLARGLGAELQLLHVWSRHPGSTAAVNAAIRQHLQRAAASRELQGIDVSVAAERDYPPYEGIVRHARKVRADLVIAELHRHGRVSRALLTHTDWELIRVCPVPLLLVHTDAPWRRPALIASIDPMHERDKPGQLDADIMRTGQAVADALQGSLHAFHAHVPLAVQVPSSVLAPLPDWIPAEMEQKYSDSTERAFERLCKAAHLPPRRRHLLAGGTVPRLRELAKAFDSAIVVMGAVSRSGLGGVYFGNTAEQVFAQIDADILVIKPRGFRSPVPTARPRGVNLIGPVLY
jgi:universal stress protein E